MTQTQLNIHVALQNLRIIQRSLLLQWVNLLAYLLQMTQIGDKVVKTDAVLTPLCTIVGHVGHLAFVYSLIYWL